MGFHIRTALLSTALIIPVAVPVAMRAAEPPRYHDNQHNDDHQWNSHEDRAYRMWAKENHRKYVAFDKLRAEDQQSYWGWRHEHSDIQLKINIP